MHIVVIPNTFPDKDHPYRGIFFLKQAEAIARSEKTGMVIPDVRSIREVYNLNTIGKLGKITTIAHEKLHITAQTAINILPGNDAFLKYIFPLTAENAFKKYIETEGKPDIIHAHVALYAGYAAMKLSKKYNIPFVVTEHSSAFSRQLYNKRKIDVIKEVYKNASAVIVVSEALKYNLEALNIEKGIHVIPNLVDTDLFNTTGAVKNKNQLFSLANLVPNKGFDTLLKAFACASKKNDLLKLRIGGQGPLLNELKKLAKDLGIDEKVNFLGKLNQQQVKEELNRSGIFILTSRVETFGVVLLEAMAAGLPVIATKSGGPQNIVKPFNGILCNVDEIIEICNAIVELTNNYNNFNAEEIRNYIQQTYSSQVISDQLIMLYNKILQPSL